MNAVRFIGKAIRFLLKAALVIGVVIWLGGSMMVLCFTSPPSDECKAPYYVFTATWPAWKYLADQPLLKLFRWSEELCDAPRTNLQK